MLQRADQSPSAWIRTTARARRSHRPVRFRGHHAPGRRIQSWLAPLAAAVAVAAIGIAAATGYGNERIHATTGPSGQIGTGGQPGTTPGHLLPPRPSATTAFGASRSSPRTGTPARRSRLAPAQGSKSGGSVRRMDRARETAWLQKVTGGTLLCVDTPDGDQPGTNWMVVPPTHLGQRRGPPHDQCPVLVHQHSGPGGDRAAHRHLGRGSEPDWPAGSRHGRPHTGNPVRNLVAELCQNRDPHLAVPRRGGTGSRPSDHQPYPVRELPGRLGYACRADRHLAADRQRHGMDNLPVLLAAT